MNAIPGRYNGSRLREILRAQGRRQDWLATEAGISTTHLSHLLAGKRTISREVAERIASALQVPFFLAFESPIGSEAALIGNDQSRKAA